MSCSASSSPPPPRNNCQCKWTLKRRKLIKKPVVSHFFSLIQQFSHAPFGLLRSFKKVTRICSSAARSFGSLHQPSETAAAATAATAAGPAAAGAAVVIVVVVDDDDVRQIDHLPAKHIHSTRQKERGEALRDKGRLCSKTGGLTTSVEGCQRPDIVFTLICFQASIYLER